MHTDGVREGLPSVNASARRDTWVRPAQLATFAVLRTGLLAWLTGILKADREIGGVGSSFAVPRTIMSIILFVLFGIVAGFLARAIMPGRQSMSIVMTGLLGIAGSFVGGFVGSLLTGASVLEFNTSGIVGSVLGALVVLALMGFAGRRRAHA